MFSYIDCDSFLHRRNPMVKLGLILAITIIVCISYYPLLPVVTILATIALTVIGGNISVKVFVRKMGVFITIALIFMFSMTLLRGLSFSKNAAYFLGPFSWSQDDIINIVTLGFRIIAFATMTLSFVATTKTRDFALSIILQCKVEPVRGYAIMAAYRFLPELQGYVNSIHLAQEVRGIDWQHGVNRFLSPFRVFIPLFCLAARRGEKFATAMESRGLGGKIQRTYYSRTEVSREDWALMICVAGFYILLITILAVTGNLHFTFNV